VKKLRNFRQNETPPEIGPGLAVIGGPVVGGYSPGKGKRPLSIAARKEWIAGVRKVSTWSFFREGRPFELLSLSVTSVKARWKIKS
jgi:hypothetical protein